MGRKVDGLKETFKNLTGKDVRGETIGEVLENFNNFYEDVVTTISVKDSKGEAITDTVIVIKIGGEVGSGDTVTSEADGSYKIKVGLYNYSVSKASYVANTGTFEIDGIDAKSGIKNVEVILELE